MKLLLKKISVSINQYKVFNLLTKFKNIFRLNIRNHTFFILLLLCVPFFSQNKNSIIEIQKKEIYRLIRESDKFNGSNDLKSLQLAKDATKLAETIGTSKEKAKCYMIIANILTSLGLYDQSFDYLEKSLNEPYAKDDMTHQIITKQIKANNYWKLNLKNQAITEQKNIISTVNSQPEDYGLTYFKALALRDLGLWNSKINKQDSALIYLKQAELILKKFPKLETSIHFYEIPNIYLIKGDIFLMKNQQDSAIFYYNKGFNLINKNEEVAPTLHRFYFSFGEFFRLKKDYPKAISFYKKSVDEMKMHNINDIDNHTVAVLKKDLNTVSNDLSEVKKISYLQKENVNELEEALKNKETNYVIVPYNMYMDFILKNDLYILYHFSICAIQPINAT